IDDALADRRGDPVPIPPRRQWLRRESRVPPRPVAAIPRVEGCPVRAPLLPRRAHRQIRALDQPDHLPLLHPRQAHVSSSESEAVRLFLSSRFSSTVSANTCFSRLFSSRSVCTSGAVASRVVSPSSRFFPASRNSLLQR